MKMNMSLLIGASMVLVQSVAIAQAPAPAKPAKVCSVYVESGWRDSIREGDGATAENCAAFAKAAKAQHYQIGCMAPDGAINLGGPDGGKPSPDCGW